MILEHLPNGIKQLAEKRISEQKDTWTIPVTEKSTVADFFDWNRTAEGGDFWCKISTGVFAPYFEKYPEHQWAHGYPNEFLVYKDYSKFCVANLGDFITINPEEVDPAVLANGYYAFDGVSDETKEAWAKGFEYCKKNFIPFITPEDLPYSEDSKGVFDALKDLEVKLHKVPTTTAYKESNGKLFYEIDWPFITQMAEKMAANKKDGKYDLYNWKKPMTEKGLEDLKQAMLRHLIEILNGVYEDDEREFGHLESLSCNSMMLNYQLKNLK